MNLRPSGYEPDCAKFFNPIKSITCKSVSYLLYALVSSCPALSRLVTHISRTLPCSSVYQSENIGLPHCVQRWLIRRVAEPQKSQSIIGGASLVSEEDHTDRHRRDAVPLSYDQLRQLCEPSREDRRRRRRDSRPSSANNPVAAGKR